MRAGKQVRYTAVPNPLLDDIMPKLGDTELRLLLVIVRQTIGWIDPKSGQPKESDWLSHPQLRNRTGRSSSAISRAIERLVQLRIITVRSAVGELLGSASERRRHKGNLHFELCFDGFQGGPEAFPSKRRIPNQETTKANLDKAVVSQNEPEVAPNASISANWQQVGELLRKRQKRSSSSP